jgi:hypothetical protein
MSDHHQPSSTPNPDPPAAPDDETLIKMQHDFPRHRIWREFIPGRTIYVARSLTEASQPGGTP